MEVKIMQIPQGVVLWEGKSRLNGDPTVAIATGLKHPSGNAKTGEMVQTWILRQDISPSEAIKTGGDAGICGNCIHRAVEGQGSCYVNVGWGPTRIWKAYNDGVYPPVTPELRNYIRELHVRYGSYGEPAAVPAKTWRAIMPENPKDSTGYTHQWHLRLASEYKDFLMASVESQAESEEAEAKGWRTFLVVPRNRPSIPQGFKWCPKDELNPGKKIPCESCGACNGTRGGQSSNIAVYAHGTSAKLFHVGRERKSLVQLGNRKHLKYDSLVRVERDLHADVKAHAKTHGMGLKTWVAKAILNQMKREQRRSKA